MKFIQGARAANKQNQKIRQQIWNTFLSRERIQSYFSYFELVIKLCGRLNKCSLNEKKELCFMSIFHQFQNQQTAQ
jgi:hypothetical protein